MKSLEIGSQVKAIQTVRDGGPGAGHTCTGPGQPCDVGCPGFIHAEPGAVGTVVGLTDAPAIVTVTWGETATDCWVGAEVIPYVPNVRSTWALADMISEAVMVARDCGLHGNELADFAREMAVEWTRGGK